MSGTFTLMVGPYGCEVSSNFQKSDVDSVLTVGLSSGRIMWIGRIVFTGVGRVLVGFSGVGGLVG